MEAISFVVFVRLLVVEKSVRAKNEAIDLLWKKDARRYIRELADSKQRTVCLIHDACVSPFEKKVRYCLPFLTEFWNDFISGEGS